MLIPKAIVSIQPLFILMSLGEKPHYLFIAFFFLPNFAPRLKNFGFKSKNYFFFI